MTDPAPLPLGKPDPAHPRIATFWIGPRLPNFHHMCVKSWLLNGYEVAFYAYDPVSNVPPGVTSYDAATVLDRRVIFDDAPDLARSPHLRADIFRLALLQAGAGVWCDADYYMLRPFDPIDRLLLGRERNGKLCNAILWLPSDFEAMPRVIDAFRRRTVPIWSYTVTYWRRAKVLATGGIWSHRYYPGHQWGRHALEFFIWKHGLGSRVKPYESFYWPVIYDYRAYRAAEPWRHIVEHESVRGLHFFKKAEEEFEAAEPGSFIDWAKRRVDLAATVAPPS